MQVISSGKINIEARAKVVVHGLPSQDSKILKDVEMCQAIKVQVWQKREE